MHLCDVPPRRVAHVDRYTYRYTYRYPGAWQDTWTAPMYALMAAFSPLCFIYSTVIAVLGGMHAPDT